MQNNHLLGKGLVVGIVLLFVGTGVIPSTAKDIENTSLPTPKGNWLYVGGSEPGNYTYIQDALDNATEGDIIYVYSGTYYEDIVIEKSISLIGQDKNTTIIEGAGDIDDTISVFFDNVKISGFIIKNNGPYGAVSVILYAQSNGSSIIGNIFIGDDVLYGGLFSSIYIVGSNHNLISDNVFEKGTIRIYYNCNYNEISNNVFESTVEGIFLYNSSNNIIKYNKINGGAEGICISYSNNNIISYNSIKNCDCGIYLVSENCEITYNNFISNKIKAKIYSKENEWDHNYWGLPRFLPKPIIWLITGVDPEDGFWWRFIIDFDWHPAQKPYDIS